MLSFPGYQQWPGGVKKSKWGRQDKKDLLPIRSEEAKAWAIGNRQIRGNRSMAIEKDGFSVRPIAI